MDKRFAIVRDGQVENVVLWDGIAAWEPPVGTTAVEIPADGDAARCGPGWVYAAGSLTPPEAP